MKRTVLLLALLISAALQVAAQTATNRLPAEPVPYQQPTGQIRFGPTDPTTCQAGVGQVFLNTTSGMLKFCSADDTWTMVSGLGYVYTFIEVGGPSTPAANQLKLYAKDKSGVSTLYFKKDDGTEVEVGSGGGGGTPGGSDTQLQYNNAGAFGGISGATTDGTTLTLVAPTLGTPASGTLTNTIGLPIGTGVSGLGLNIATFLGTPSSANLIAALTDETGSGVAVFGTTPSFTTGFTIGGVAASRKVLVGNGTNFVASTETYAVPGSSGNVLTSDGTNWTSAAPAGGGANTALGNLASVAINTDLLPASTQGLGNASFPFLGAFIGNTTQYESVSQSAGLITHAVLGSATNIGWNWATKGTGLFKVTSPTVSGASVLEVRPVSGASFTRINDNGTVVIDADASTGSVPLNVKYNGSTILNLPFSGNLAINALGVAGGIFGVDSGGIPSLISNTLSFKLGASSNVGIKYNAAGAAEVNNATAGQWGSLQVGNRDSGTNTVTPGLYIEHQSSGSPAAGLGSAINLNLPSTTTTGQTAAQLAAVWTTATHASRTADVVISTVNGAASLAESFRAKANGDAVSQGNLIAAVAGKGLQLQSGSGARAGNATLVGGSATVTNTTVTANTLVLLTRKATGGTIGMAVTYSVSAGVSFTISSDNVLDTSTYSYMLVEVN